MDWQRRRIVAATIGVGTLAGCLGGDDSETDTDGESDDGETVDDETGEDNDETDVIEWNPTDRDPDEYLEVADDEFVDRTGEDPVEIVVDPDGDGFDPAGFEIDSRTVVEWTWAGESEDIYPIAIPPECEWRGQGGAFAAGDSWDRLFWADGTYVYGSRDADGEEFTGAFRVHDEDDGEDASGETGDDE